MGMPAIVEDSPERLTGAQLGQAITLLSAQSMQPLTACCA